MDILSGNSSGGPSTIERCCDATAASIDTLPTINIGRGTWYGSAGILVGVLKFTIDNVDVLNVVGISNVVDDIVSLLGTTVIFETLISCDAAIE